MIARQSTAKTIMIGPVLDSSGAAVTDCVVADFEGSVNGGDPAALNGSATLTHRGVGFYSLALTATDLATVGTFQVVINDGTNCCPLKDLVVIEEAIYDAFYAASANAFAGAAGSTTLTALASGSITAAVIATGAIDAATFATNALNAVWSEPASRTLTAATNITSDGSPITMALSGLPSVDVGFLAGVELTSGPATNFVTFYDNDGNVSALFLDGVATASALATVDSELGTVDSLIDSLTIEVAKIPKSDGTATWNATALASINAQVDTALFDIHLDHLFQTTYDPASKPGAADALLNELVENDGGVARYTANALEQAPSGTGASAADIVEAMFDVDTGLDYGDAVAGSVVKEIVDNAGGSGLTLQDVVDGVWNEPTGDHTTAGTTGAMLTATGLDAASAVLNTISIISEIGTAGAGLTAIQLPSNGLANVTAWTVGITGNITGNLSGSVGSVTGTVGSVTGNVGGNVVGSVVGAVGSVTGAVGSVTGNVGGNVVGSVGSVTGLTVGNLDATVSSRLASASYTAPPSAATIASTILAAGDVDGFTLEQTLKLCLAALAGKLSGAATTTITIRSADDSANRITATVDSDGNRTAVTLNAAG